MIALARHILDALALLSLALCLATASLWLRGLWVGDFVRHNTPRGATRPAT